MAFEVAQALKRYGAVCPFLSHASVSSLRQYSTQSLRGTYTNRLTELASTRCPLMSHALAERGFATSAVVPAHQPPATTNQATPKSPSTLAHSPSPAALARGYASIAEVQENAVRRATETSQAPQPAFVNPASISRDAHSPNEVHSEGRPTCALGFAKHRITSFRPGFDYEAFYSGELAKKHQDKSYRVSERFFHCRALSGFLQSSRNVVLTPLPTHSTSITSTGSPPSIRSLTRPTRPMK